MNNQASQKHNLTTHGLSKHPLFKIWKGIRSRVTLDHFSYYKGRGIKCCERWQHFEAFFEDMLPGWAPGLEIDRIDPTGDYAPENCRWLTRAENCRNKTNSIFVQFRGERIALASAIAAHGKCPLSTAYARIKKGWDAEAAILTPKQVNRKVPISVNGVVYPSMKDAAVAEGVTRTAILNRLKKHPGRVFYIKEKP